MITIAGFLPSVADDIARYLSSEIPYDHVTISADSTPQDGINIISSDKTEKRQHSNIKRCIYIGSKALPIPAEDSHIAVYETIPIHLPQLKELVSRWLDEAGKQLELTHEFTYSTIERTIKNQTGETLALLTEKESELLLFMHAHPEQSFDKDTLLKEVWGYNSIDTHTLETHIYRLRGKLSAVLPENKGLLTSDNGYALSL